MTRMVMISILFAVLYLLFLLESTRLSRFSNLTEPTVSFDLETHEEFQAARGNQLADNLRMHYLYSSSADSSTSSAPVQKDRSSLRGLPVCVSDGGVAKSFLLIFMGHSGSSAIISELQSHSRVLIEAPEPIDHYEYEFNTSLALEYARAFFLRGIGEGRVPGFKMRPWHIGQQPEAWAAVAEEFGTRIIWQYRRNILKQAVGEYSKKYFDDKSSVEGLRNEEQIKNRCNTGAGCRFTISDFEFFHSTLKDCLHSDLAIVRGVNFILNGSKCVYDLPYEDYLYHREETMFRLQRFLGVEYEHTTPTRFKATSDNLCDVVENWDEVCENFYGCHVWRHMFDDIRTGCSCDFSSGWTKYCDTVFED